MDGAASLQLGQLLRASDAVGREAAWDSLILHHTRLLLAIARSFGGGADEAMDRYSYILEKLRESDFHRLRLFDSDLGASFSTWLTVTSRRLCLDHHRQQYGRHRASNNSDQSELIRGLRRALVDSIRPELDLDDVPDSLSPSPEDRTIMRDRNSILRSELARLSPRERLLLALRFEDGLTASRIALVIGLATPFNVYRQVNGTLARLRVALQSRGIESADG